MNTTTKIGVLATTLIITGLEVNAEIALEEPEFPQGLDEAVRKLIVKHGLNSVLGAIHHAASDAAEVTESEDTDDAITALRLRVFGNRLGEAIEALK
jgi:hypothetical protein